MADVQKTVAIFGTSKARVGDGIFEQAFKLGSLLADNGMRVANGGYGGVMLASAHGASSKGGEAVGVTCSKFGRGSANEYISKEIRTKSLQERLETLVNSGDAYVVLPGGTGTLLELGHIWEFKNKHFLNESKPIIILGGFWKPLVEMITNIDSESADHVTVVQTAEEVIEILNKE
jgi:uncharacterized protein (TIGR00730 family)